MTSSTRGAPGSGASLPLMAGLLFGSGFCALTCQVAWQREFRLIFGASTAASAAVLAIFMGGLGAGSLYFGQRADAHPRPLVLYAKLEGAVAVLAALTPPLLRLGRLMYIAAGGATVLGQAGGTLARLAVAALVVLPATFLMGGTLPAASRAAEVEADTERGRLALVYGLNTLGAVTGGLAATFVLLEILGTRETIWAACLVEALVAVIAGSAARSAAAIPSRAGTPDHEGPRVPVPRAPLVASALVGFAFFLMELVWYRMLAPLLGGTVFAFGLILAAALVGIGLGGVIYSQIVAPRMRTASIAGFSILCTAEAFCLLAPFAAGDRIAALVLALKPLDLFGFSGHLTRSAVICLLVIIPAATVSGIQFPWLVAMMGTGNRDVGRHVGAAYALNTVGAVVGALAGGFGLIPKLSAPGCWLFASGCLAILGLLSALRALREPAGRMTALTALVLTAACIPLMLARGPTAFWRTSPIGIGRVHMAEGSGRNELHAFANKERRSIRWARDGIESHVALQDVNGHTFIVNGKSDGNAIGDADTQVMGGLLGAILRPKARRSLVIGLGTGSTAGWLGAVPNMARVDVAELEPAILDVARECDAVNQHVLDNPKVHVTLGDARELILTSRSKYDIVFSEPSNPFRAGVASLFTKDFYDSVAQILDQDGVFLQWVQGYEVDGQTIRDIYTTMAASFPEIETWQTDNGDLILVASQKAHRYDLAEIARRTTEEPFKSALRLAWRVDGVDGFFSHFVAKPSFARAVAAGDGNVSTDDLNLIEYGFARTMSGGRLGFEVAQLREVARARGEDRPDVAMPSWDGVELDRLVLSFLGPGGPLPIRPGAQPGDPVAARLAAYRGYSEGDPGRTLSEWRTARLRPLSFFDELVVAQAMAREGDDATLSFIEQHLADRPMEADAIRARYFDRTHQLAEASRALERALTAFHTDPWAPTDLVTATFELAESLARADRSEALRLLELFQAPFAAGAVEDLRQTTRYHLLKQLDDASRCQSLAHELEPDPPWLLDYLSWRRDCYAATRDPLVSRADADVREFLRGTTAGFSVDGEARARE